MPRSTLPEVQAGRVRHVYDPTPVGAAARYLDGHSLFQGPDQAWHLFATVGKRPASGRTPAVALGGTVAHARAPMPLGPWANRPPALTVDPGYFGEQILRSPHVLGHGGLFYLFYAAGGGAADGSSAAINLATSPDLDRWTRWPPGPLFRDGHAARDPHVTRIGRMWAMFYTATEHRQGGHHVVACRTSPDLVRWSGRRITFLDRETVAGHPSSTTESPFILQRGAWWYLFLGPRDGYLGTDVYRSRNPLYFSAHDIAGRLPVRGAEVIADDGRQWVTGTGRNRDGLYLAELRWRSLPPGEAGTSGGAG
jgi:hypothetical protein